MKQSKTEIIVLIIILVVSQPFITSLIVDNDVIVNSIVLVGTILSIVIAYHLLKVYINKYSHTNQTIIKKNLLLKSEMNRMKEASKYNCLFYEHLVDEPFSKLSDSVENLIGVDKEEFKKNFERYNGGALFNGIFDKVKRFEKAGLKVPVYKTKLFTNEGETIWLRVHEVPIYDNNNKLEKVWGIAYKTLEKSYTKFLAESEYHTKYKTLLNITNDAVFLMKNDRFVDCNTKALEMFGASLNQLILYTPFNYRFSPKIQPNGKASQEEAIDKIKKAYKGQPQSFDWTHLRLKGDAFNAKVNLKAVTVQGEKVLFATIKDTSAVIELKEELETISRLNKIAFFESPRPLLKHDKDGGILEVNQSFLTTFNTTEENCLNKKYFEFFDNEALLNLVYKAQKNNKSESSITEIKQLDSEIALTVFIKAIPIFYRDFYDGGIILIEEKTENKLLKQRLNRKEKELRDILKYSTDMIYKYNVKASSYEYVSQSVFDLFGYSSKEFIGFNAEELKSLLHPKELRRANSLITKLMPEFETNQQVNVCNIVHKDGRVRRIRDVFYYTRSIDNGEACVIGFVSDITDDLDTQVALTRGKSILKTIAESQEFGVIVIFDFKIAYVNTYVERMMACNVSDLLNVESLFVFADEGEKERLKKTYIGNLSKSNKPFEMTYWVKNTLGEYIYLSCVYKKLAGNINHIYVSTKNITQDLIDEYHQTKSEDLKATLTKYLKSF